MEKLTKLQKAVIEQLGDRESLKDVLEHGADGGFSGFTMYSETVEFYYKHKKDIVAHLEETSHSCGYPNTIAMVQGFRCISDNGYSTEEVAKVLYGPCKRDWSNSDYLVQIANALAWYALEETARELEDK